MPALSNSGFRSTNQPGVVVSPLNGMLVRHRLTRQHLPLTYLPVCFSSVLVPFIPCKWHFGRKRSVRQSNIPLGTDSVYFGKVFASARLKMSCLYVAGSMTKYCPLSGDVR